VEHPLIDEKKIVVYGQSLGGAVAIDLVAKHDGKVQLTLWLPTLCGENMRNS
jgi:cephalosporin-C deacetylase-like acetyl esterase